MKGGNRREAWKNYYQTSRCTHISNVHRKVGQKEGMKAVAEKKLNETEKIKKSKRQMRVAQGIDRVGWGMKSSSLSVR